MEPVLTHRAKTVVDAARLHRVRERRQRGLTLIEGPELVGDAVAAGVRVVQYFTTLPDNTSADLPEHVSVTSVDEQALARLSGTKTPRGPVAVVETPVEWLDRSRSLLVSVGVSDPGNVGTMIRSAAAFGWGYAYMEGSADPWSPKTLRAGAAGQFQTPIARIGSLAELKGWTTIATVAGGGDPPEAIGEGLRAVLIGEEANGLPDWAISAAEWRMTISAPGPTESLNAAVAAGIAMYALGERPGEAAGHV